MPTSGPTTPSTFSNDATVGSGTWSFPGSGTIGSVSLGSSEQSKYLKGLDLGSTFVPAGVTPTGLTLSITGKGLSLNFVADTSIKLVVGGSIVGAEKSTGSTWSTVDVLRTYTWTQAELLALGVTAAVLNSSTFGAVLSTTADPPDTAIVDGFTVTATYAAGSLMYSAARKMSNRIVMGFPRY